MGTDRIGVMVTYIAAIAAIILAVMGAMTLACGDPQAAICETAQASFLLLLGIWLHVCS